ncbi:MAG: hypothetical protein KF752_01000 [Pirellulaceae bacterium]|nr:hypothetical protein [Pirellulaceae bacterium]
MTSCQALDEKVELAAIACQLATDEVYDKLACGNVDRELHIQLPHWNCIIHGLA